MYQTMENRSKATHWYDAWSIRIGSIFFAFLCGMAANNGYVTQGAVSDHIERLAHDLRQDGCRVSQYEVDQALTRR